MTESPKISVLIAGYNSETTVIECLQSMTAQRFSDFDIWFLDDCSTDKTYELVLQYGLEREPRLRVFRNEHNLGLTKSLNKLLDLSQASGCELIARIDADDIAHPERLMQQVQAFDAQPELVIVGSNYLMVDANGSDLGPALLPSTDQEIRRRLFFENPFAHPSIMYRRSALEKAGGYYNEGYRTTQDYELWSRLLQHGRALNLKPMLLTMRRHEDSISATKRNIQIANTKAIQRSLLEDLGPSPSATKEQGFDLELIQKGFMQSRAQADAMSIDRFKAIQEAYTLAAFVDRKLQENSLLGQSPAFWSWFVQRCLRVGIKGQSLSQQYRLLLLLITRCPISTLTAPACLVLQMLEKY